MSDYRMVVGRAPNGNKVAMIVEGESKVVAVEVVQRWTKAMIRDWRAWMMRHRPWERSAK